MQGKNVPREARGDQMSVIRQVYLFKISAVVTISTDFSGLRHIKHIQIFSGDKCQYQSDFFRFLNVNHVSPSMTTNWQIYVCH